MAQSDGLGVGGLNDTVLLPASQEMADDVATVVATWQPPRRGARPAFGGLLRDPIAGTK